jgi:pyoverdine/dityrosine biosynthesis protein Dit1
MIGKSQYSIDTLRELVTGGATRAEIMKQMNIKSHPTFINLLLRLMNTDHKYYELHASKTQKKKQAITAKIGSLKTLTLSAKTLDESPFEPGTVFNVGFTDKKITLTVVE